MVYNRKKDECRTERANGVFAYIADQSRDLEEGRRSNTPSFANYSAWVMVSLAEP
jgi:hypothetical protein